MNVPKKRIIMSSASASAFASAIHGRLSLYDNLYDLECHADAGYANRDRIFIGQLRLSDIESTCQSIHLDLELLQGNDAKLDELVKGTLVIAHLRPDQVYLLKAVHTEIKHDQVFIFVTSTEGYNSDVYASYMRETNGNRAVFLFVGDMQRLMDPEYLKELLSLNVDRALDLMNDPQSPFRPSCELSYFQATLK
jgi:hypothetical protein